MRDGGSDDRGRSQLSPDAFHDASIRAAEPAHAITVTDSHFLCDAAFKRAGDDLRLIGSDGKIDVVSGYYKSEHPSVLRTPDSAALRGDLVAALAGPAESGKHAAANAPQPIGRAVKIEGNASVVRNGVAVTLNDGLPRMLTATVQDPDGSAHGGHDLASASMTRSVTAVNDAGALTLGETSFVALEQTATAVPPRLSLLDIHSATLDRAAVQITGNYQRGDEIYAVTIGDGRGGSATQDVTVTVTGTEDAPVLAAGGSGAVTEAAGAGAQDIAPIAGTLSITDSDAGATLTASIVGSSAVTLDGHAFSLPAWPEHRRPPARSPSSTSTVLPATSSRSQRQRGAPAATAPTRSARAAFARAQRQWNVLARAMPMRSAKRKSQGQRESGLSQPTIDRSQCLSPIWPT